MKGMRRTILAWVLAFAMFLEPAAAVSASAQELPAAMAEAESTGKTGEGEAAEDEKDSGQDEGEAEEENENQGGEASEEGNGNQGGEASEEENGNEGGETAGEKNENEGGEASGEGNENEGGETAGDENGSEAGGEAAGEEDTNDGSGEADDDDAEEKASELERGVLGEEEEDVLRTEKYDDPDALYQAGSFDVVIEMEEDGYSALDEAEQSLRDQAIAAIYAGLCSKTAQIDVSAYGFTRSKADELAAVYYGIVNDHPELYYVRTGFSYTSRSDGTITALSPLYMDYDFDDKAFQQATADAMALIETDMSDMEKALVLHDYLAVICAYDYDNLQAGTLPAMVYNAYGVLVERSAVCQGYALAYKYLLGQAGVDAYMVSSDTMNHAWNLIKLDGEYYQVDVTWDDPVSDKIGRACHNYMFISDATFQSKKGHSNWKVTTASEETNITATNTQYEDAFWTGCSAQIHVQDHKYYYVDGSSRAVCERTYDGASSKSLVSLGYWRTWDQSGYWGGTFTGLSNMDGLLVYNDSTKIYSIKKDGTGQTELFTPDTSQGYIYGSYYEDGTVYYEISQTPNERGSVYSAELETGSAEIEEIELDKTTLELAENTSATLNATVTPVRADCSELSWSSSRTDVVSITAPKGAKSAAITALKEGSSTITLTDGSHTATCQVTVNGQLDAPEFSPAAGSIDKGETITITAQEGAEIYYLIGEGDPVSQGSRYTEPIKAEEDMSICAAAKKEGWGNSEKAAASYIVCTNLLTLDQTSLKLVKGEEETLSITELPTTKQETEVSWSSDKESVATVEEGTVKAVGAGTAKITAQVSDHKGRTVTAVCDVEVELPEYTVSFYSATGVLLKQQSVTEGEDAVPPTELPEYPGQEFDGWDGSYTNVEKDLELHAVYRMITYQITYVLDAGEIYPETAENEENPTTYTIKDDLVFADAVGTEQIRFDGWYEKADYSGAAVTGYAAGHTGDITLYAKWRDGSGLHMKYKDESGKLSTKIEAQIYTGAAIKPEILVYNGAELLTLGKDYKLSYKNNKTAYEIAQGETGFLEKKAPCVIIQGIGNYTGKITEYFVICRKDIGDEDVTAENLVLSYNNGRSVKAAPVLLWNGKKLNSKKEYQWDYVLEEQENGAGKEIGTWHATLTGIGNFKGTKQIQIEITGSTPLAKCKVRIADQPYEEGAEVSLTPEDIQLTCGSKKLTEDQYEYEILDTDMEVGTHQVLFTGKGEYAGTLRGSFKITGQSLKKAKISGIQAQVYCGDQEELEAKIREEMSVELNGEELTEGIMYETSFAKTDRAGTAKLTVTGIGGYTGTITKSIKIGAYDIKEDAEGYLEVEFAEGTDTYAYARGGVKPEVQVSFRGEILMEGTDYKVSYQNNKAVTTEKTKKLPAVVITGKKNLAKACTVPFAIEKQDFRKVTAYAADVTVSSKPGKYRSTPVLTDPDGTKLRAGTDYSKTFVYLDEDGNELDKKAQPKAGDKVKVRITPAGNYEGEPIEAVYHVLAENRDISKAKVSVNGKIYYNGSKVTLKEADITLKIKNQRVDPENYVIIGYQQNDRKGKATITIQGKESKGYGGIKKLSFQILPQTMSWQSF